MMEDPQTENLNMGVRGKRSKIESDVDAVIASRRISKPRKHSGAPKHLGKEGRALYDELHRDLDVAGVAILTRAAEALDRLADAQAEIGRDGALVETNWGRKQHPANA